MGNCLVTKLKGNVNNDNLSKLGTIKAEVLNLDPGTRTIVTYFAYKNADYATKVKLIGCTFNGESEFNVNANTLLSINSSVGTFVRTAEKCYIEFYKYGNIALETNNLLFNVGDLEYASISSDLQIGAYTGSNTYRVGAAGNIEGLYPALIAGSNPAGIQVRISWDSHTANQVEGLKVYGDLTPMGIDFKLKRLYIGGFTNSATNGCHGSLDNLGYTADTLDVIDVEQDAVTLDIVNFVKKARKKGVTEKTMTELYDFNHILVTFNGELVRTAHPTLSWTASTITFDGVTIENSDIEP